MGAIKLLLALLLVQPLVICAQSEGWSDFTNGKRITYTTLGNLKAKGLEVSFQYPQSWAGVEGRRPNTLFQVTSAGGKGLEICNLVIKAIPLPADYVPSKQEIAEMFIPSELPGFMPDGARYLGGAPTTLDGQPGAWINYIQEMDRAGMQLRLIFISYATYFDKRMILFNCSVGDTSNKPRSELEARYRANLPLFQQFANSLIIVSKWRK